jgi:restriction system protein
MLRDMWDQMGTPQNPVDWSDPDEWIPQRLRGKSAELARKLWEGSGKEFNPRYGHGSYLFTKTYRLLDADSGDILHLTDGGKGFLDEDPIILRDLDEQEGLLELLSILATKTRAMRADMLPEWSEYLLERSNFSTSSTFKDTLRRRLLNLVEREMISRDGNVYSIREKGIAYLSGPGRGETDLRREVIRVLNSYSESQKELLRERLTKTTPSQFERLVRDLLEAMGYQDVQITGRSGDRGVDVVGTAQYGITTIKEFVQVKRHRASIQRPILDQLRGALPYHQAIRGTIITLGTFSSGAKQAALFPGAAPITLIDGDRLIELLVKHEIGIKSKPAVLFQIDDAYFTESGEEEVISGEEVLQQGA